MIEARLAELRGPEVVEMTQQEHGGLDILVNNAVVRYFGGVEDISPEHWNEALAANLSAPFHAIRLASPGLKRSGWGRTVNIAPI